MSNSDNSDKKTSNPLQPDPLQPDATNCNNFGAEAECNIGLSDRHRAAVELLCIGGADGDVAAALQIHRVTLYRWKSNPLFAAALRARRAQLTQQSADRFRCLLTAALNTFEKQITDPYVPTAYRAARGLLALAQLNKLLLPSIDEPPTSELPPSPSPPVSDLSDDSHQCEADSCGRTPTVCSRPPGAEG